MQLEFLPGSTPTLDWAHWQAAKHVSLFEGYYAPEAHLQALYLS